MIFNRSLVVGFTVYILISGAWCAPQIDTDGETVNALIGKTATFKCHVTGLEATQKVVWKFIDHNITISAGNNIQVAEGTTKYEIFRPQDVGTFWNLRVFKLEASDEGTYKCYVTGSEDSVKVIHHLDVVDAPQNPPANFLDVTSCCKQRNVSCSLAVCRSNTSAEEYLKILSTGSECIDNELYDVIYCGQGGRNHMGCCMRTDLPEVCLALCGGVNVDGDFSSCIIHAPKILTCFMEGTTWLPSQPVSVSASVSGNIVMVSWQPPLENADKVTGYRVNYREAGADHYMQTMPLSGDVPFYQVPNLKKNTLYEFNVLALATAGSSQPSYPVEISTKGDLPDASNVSQTIATCCQGKGVGEDCVPFCQADSYQSNIHPDIYIKCFGDLTKMYQCYTGQGNHTPCCQRMNVPSDCSYLCEGQVPVQWDVVKCFKYLPVISACVQENWDRLPPPPLNTHIVPGSLTTDAVTVQWDPPSNDVGLHYIVAWRAHTATTVHWNTVEVETGTIHRITDLKSITAYDVQVSTVNDNGSSLPELTLVVITEGITNEKPFNETECCLNKNVGTDCIHICDHHFRLTEAAAVEGIKCANDLVAMIECASDWRNHTECCIREGVPLTCQGICALKNTDSDDLLQYIGCIDYLTKISACFDEGKEILPRAPLKFAIKSKTQTSIALDWLKPAGPAVDIYKVKSRLAGADYWMEKNTTGTFIVLDKLKTGSGYYFEAYSINEKGTSLPSYMLKAITLSVPDDKPIDWTRVWQNRTECCAENDVSDACQPTCHGAAFDQNLCINDLDKIITCSADGKDHSACCSRTEKFPDICLAYCKGQTPPRSPQYAHCLLYVNTMYTCFSEGQGLLPSPPLHLYVEDYSQVHITIAWQPPAENCDPSTCKYTAMLWKAGEHNDAVTRKDMPAGQTRYVFTKLTDFTRYQLTVVASNGNGNSLPAAVITVLTESSVSTSLSVSQFPNGVIDTGSSVQLECVVRNHYYYQIMWMFKSQVKINSNTYSIAKVDKYDEGVYTCNVSLGDQMTLAKNLTLNVKYEPRSMGIVADSVLPGTGQDADITCWFKGFPDIISWSKDGNSLQDNTKYLPQPLKYDLSTGNTTSILRVLSVGRADFGKYTCHGVNKFGSNSITGVFAYAYPTVAPPTKPPGVNTSECCRQLGVQEKCIPRICTFAIDIVGVAMDSSLSDCLLDFEKFLTCGADGRDHTSCCKSKDVSDYCLPFCAGKSPDFTDSLEMLQCITHAATIMDCVENGHNLIPSAPQNVVAVQEYNGINVHWDPPSKNPQLVSVYDIFYTKGTDKSFVSVSQPFVSHTIKGILKGNYNIWVIALNDFGQSHKSNIVNVPITKIGPSAPQDIKASIVDINNIRVSWHVPSSGTPSGGYAVHYGPRGLPPVTVINRGLETRLESLLFNTEYIIYVGAVNEDGEGEPTNKISVKTGKNPSTGTTASPPRRDDNQKKIGLAVGLTLGIILLLAVALVAFLLYRRNKASRYSPRETVAFENPQYGPKITGLPGEGADEDRQFQYGHLQEESEANNAYSTLEHPDVHSPESAATVQLEHQS